MMSEEQIERDYAERQALVELLIALPALPKTWPAGAVQSALHRALIAHEAGKSTVRRRRSNDAASTASVGNQHANNEFIGACLEFDELLAKLTALRADHFGVNPEAPRNWGEVGSIKEGVRILTEAVRFLTPAGNRTL